MKPGIFITVRTNSSRLRAKALKLVNSRPIISYLITRFKHVVGDGVPVIICTTTLQEDYVLDELAMKYGTRCFHGDPENILKRHLECAKHFNLDFIINIDGDDILCDPGYVSEILKIIEKDSSFDIVKTKGLPFGVNSMGYKREVLEKALSEYPADKIDTGWGQVLTDSVKYKILEIPAREEDKLEVRLSLDYEEDFLLFKAIIEKLFSEGKYISHQEVISLLKENPQLIQINAHLNEVYWKNFNAKKAEEGR